MDNVCAYMAICGEDAIWVPLFLEEMERLKCRFAVHLDRCSEKMTDTLLSHRLCTGATFQEKADRPFGERDKQRILDMAHGVAEWAMAMDCDETWENGAEELIPRELAAATEDLIDVRWLTLWGDKDHIRVDQSFLGGHRVKFLRRRSSIQYRFTHPITNGPKSLRPSGEDARPAVRKSPLVCLHWGMMTRQLREQHKERWDRIYTAHVGNNPYGFWAMALDEKTYPPITVRHGYFRP